MQVYLLASGCKRTVESIVFFLCMLVCTPTFAAIGFEETIEKISTALKTGHAKNLGSTFASSINLSLKREDGVYTKFQAELLLEDFFRSNKVSELKEVQRVNNDSNSYLVYSLKAGDATFRVFIKLMPISKGYEVIEMRVE